MCGLSGRFFLSRPSGSCAPPRSPHKLITKRAARARGLAEIREGLTFDDVLLVPKYSDIASRSQVSLRTRISRNIEASLPLISANMDTVTEHAMAVTMAREGGIGIVHRFLGMREQADEILKVKRSGSVMVENPYTISPDQSIADALAYERDMGVSGLLVTEGDSRRLVGVKCIQCTELDPSYW